MVNEPEPHDKGPVDYSSARELKRFTDDLDWQPPAISKIILPGFLFRDGKDHTLDPYMNTRDWLLNKKIDQELLKHLTDAYQKGLEARSVLIDRIKPVEILEKVLDVWGQGIIRQEREGATLTYQYLNTQKHYRSTYIERHYEPPSVLNHYESRTTGGYSSSTPSGKWHVAQMEVKETIGVYFGNEKFHHPANLYVDELNQFFADSGSIPRIIWNRADNLGVCVTIPYALLQVQGSDIMYYFDNGAYSGHVSNVYRNHGPHPWAASWRRAVWFDQSASQQEIMDFLSKRLDEQGKVGHLPSQIEALEQAKIDELKKRGLFIEGSVTSPILHPYATNN